MFKTRFKLNFAFGLLLAGMLIISANSVATEGARPSASLQKSRSPHNPKASEAPRTHKASCLHRGPSFDRTNPEGAAQALFQKSGEGPTSALARLVLAESLSTGILEIGKCGSGIKDLQALMNDIASGIRLRQLKSKKTKIENEIFGKKQYSTSFRIHWPGSHTKPNPFAQIFLCPEKFNDYQFELHKNKSLKPEALQLNWTRIYKMAEGSAQSALDKQSVRDFEIPFRATTNFYYPESSIYGNLTPAWSKTLRKIKSAAQGCALFYGN